MANNVSHIVTVAGALEQVAAFRRRMLPERARGRGKEPSFDFEALVPIPEQLRDVGGSSRVTDGFIILGETETPEPLRTSVDEQVATMLGFPWVRDAGVVDRAGLAALLERRARDEGALNETLRETRRAIRAFSETGYVSQAEWGTEHWGVRGGAYGVEILKDEPGLLGFSFATAWATPAPIWDAIAKTFPDLTVTVLGFEEAWHFAVTGEIRGGENCVREVEPTAELYERVHGEPYEDEEEGDDAYAPPQGDASAEWRASRVVAPPVPETGWRKYKWDLVGCALAALVLAGYLLWR